MAPAQALPGSPASSPPVDEAVLAGLLDDLGDIDGELRELLIASYLTESGPQILGLVEAARAADANAAAELAHTLRAPTALLGATGLAALLELVQWQAGASPEVLRALVALVEAEYEQVTSSLTDLRTRDEVASWDVAR